MQQMDDHCKCCRQQDHCRKVYEQLGSAGLPAIGRHVVAAFLVPLAAFILAWLSAEALLPGRAAALGPLVGLVLASVAVWWSRAWLRRTCGR